MAIVVTFVALTVMQGVLERQNGEEEPWLDALPIVLTFASFAAVGAAIVARHPKNKLGWLFCLLALGTMVGNVAQQYGTLAVITKDGSLPGGVFSYWLGSWAWPLSASLIVVMPLLFPDGRVPSRRWKVVGYATGLTYALLWASFALRPGPLGDGQEFPADNPVAFPGAALLGQIGSVTGLALLVSVFVLGIASVFFRLRHATPEVRQQLKWFGYSCLATLATFFVLQPLLAPFAPESVGNFVFALGLFWLPAGMGVAILKFRLYDIDVVINRAIVYSLLTATLGASYLLSTLLLQRILPVGAQSDIGVAASTLAVAALFRPLRARIQGTIDRRFYRRKYDAARALAGFSGRLRDEVEMETLTKDVLTVVHQTLQPTSASLWLRDNEGSSIA